MKFDFNVAFIGNLFRVCNSFGIVEEHLAHFIFAFEVKFVDAHLHSVLFVNKPVRLYAQKYVLRFRILFFYIMYVVCGDGFYIKLLRKLSKPRQDYKLLLNAVILKLYVKIVLKYAFQALCQCPRLIVAVVQQ